MNPRKLILISPSETGMHCLRQTIRTALGGKRPVVTGITWGYKAQPRGGQGDQAETAEKAVEGLTT